MRVTWKSVVIYKRGKGGGSDSRNRSRGIPGAKRQGVRNISNQTHKEREEEESMAENDGYHVFSASDGESNNLTLKIENEPVRVIVDSVATCNLMSEQGFDKVSKGKI